MSARVAAVLLVLCATPAFAQDDDRPLRAPEPAPQILPWPHYAVPALEGLTMHFMLLAFSNVVTRMPFAEISGATIAHNLQLGAWTFDVDYYLTNQFGHPYQGALTFNAARSSGLSFWWSAIYATLGSLAWELFFEAEPPSMNDQITTSIGGSLLGEALHRSALQLRQTDGPRWLGLIGATLLDPLGTINDGLFEAPPIEDVTLDPLFVRWQAGATAGAVVDVSNEVLRDRMRPQALISVLLISGPPWDSRSTYDSPLSYFDLRADLAFPSKVVGNVFIRGLLVGTRFETQTVRGVWGLFGDYDYAAPAIVRASAVGLGPGVIFQVQPAPMLYLQTGALLGASPFGAAGQLDVSPDLARDYHVGPGMQALVDFRLVRPHWFQIELVLRHWLVVGAYTPPNGFEAITYLTLGANVPVWRWLGIGAEATLSDRRARFSGDGNTHDTGLALRLTVSVNSDPHFGIQGVP
jgi:opacity protein-like surface antigen